MNEIVVAVSLAVVAGVGLVLWGRKKRTGAPPPRDDDDDDDDEWCVITEVGPVRGLARVLSRSADAVVLQTEGYKATFELSDLPEVTRPLLSRARARARLEELQTPGSPDPRHGTEQFITFAKAVSRGDDAEVIAVLRSRYARPWKPTFGDRQMLRQLEGRLLPEIALVLDRDEDALRAEVHAKHAMSRATDPAPAEPPWPAKGSADEVPHLEGLAPLGTVEWERRLFVGPRLDQHADPDAGITSVAVTSGRWNAWLRQPPDDEDPQTLVLMRAGEETTPLPSEWIEVASAAPRPSPAGLQVIDEPSLARQDVMDAARYVAGTECYFGKAVCVALRDGLPEHIRVRAPHGAEAPYRVLSIELRDEDHA